MDTVTRHKKNPTLHANHFFKDEITMKTSVNIQQFNHPRPTLDGNFIVSL